MPFDIVRGKITKPEQSNQLIAAVKEYMEKNTTDGTLYLGYPLTANADEAITVEMVALLVHMYIEQNVVGKRVAIYV